MNLIQPDPLHGQTGHLYYSARLNELIQVIYSLKIRPVIDFGHSGTHKNSVNLKLVLNPAMEIVKFISDDLAQKQFGAAIRKQLNNWDEYK